LRIEKVIDGKVVQTAEIGTNGQYHCLPEGQTLNKFASYFTTIENAATYLVKYPRSRIRMNPGWALIVDDINIDGIPRENLGK
jgi:hypothetical protein